MSLIIDNLVSEGIVDLKYLRSQTTLTSVTASIQNLVATSTRFHVYTGAVTGQIIELPDATSLQIGHEYWLINESSVNITVKDFDGNSLTLVEAGQRCVAILYGAGSTAGLWAISILENVAGSTGEQFYFSYVGSGLSVDYTGGNYRHNGILYQIVDGSIVLPASTSGSIYVDTDGVIKATASIPPDATPLYEFTTDGSNVTILNDVREDVETNIIWGVLADIVGSVSGQAKSAGTSEKYARADHAHGNSNNLVKAKVEAGGSFSGTPKKFVVTFVTPFGDAAYAIDINGVDNRNWSYESKTAAGFTINSNAGASLAGEVSWIATKSGESV